MMRHSHYHTMDDDDVNTCQTHKGEGGGGVLPASTQADPQIRSCATPVTANAVLYHGNRAAITCRQKLTQSPRAFSVVLVCKVSPESCQYLPQLSPTSATAIPARTDSGATERELGDHWPICL